MYELTPEEQALVGKYNVRNTVLIEGKEGEFRKALILGAVNTVIILILLNLFISLVGGSLNFGFEVLLGLFIIFPAVTYYIFQNIRELILVGDLLDGQSFTCKSVVTLLTKEQELTKMSYAFINLLEAMKNWGGREIVKLEPYVEPTFKLIEKSDENP